jgi:xanthine dehydrogenase molybdenum-binding subunit
MKTQEYTVIGTRPIRHDGADKVTGRALYGADFQMAGLLHGFILRSPHAHARIRRIDTSKAAAFPGVKAVVTADDFPQVPERLVDLGEGDTPLSYARGNVLAQGKVLYRSRLRSAALRTHGSRRHARGRAHSARGSQDQGVWRTDQPREQRR